jgi:hypothetical protein
MQPMQPYGAGPPPKKGMSTLTIVLIIFGVLAVLGLGTCAVCVGVVSHETKMVANAIREGGALLIESPPEVKDALAGAKSAYVGAWKGKNGSSIVIDPNGHIKLDQHGTGSQRTSMELPIAAFMGDDIILREIVVITLRVSKPPHAESGHQEMVVDGIVYSRP